LTDCLYGFAIMVSHGRHCVSSATLKQTGGVGARGEDGGDDKARIWMADTKWREMIRSR